jgi:hypothetical protein
MVKRWERILVTEQFTLGDDGNVISSTFCDSLQPQQFMFIFLSDADTAEHREIALYAVVDRAKRQRRTPGIRKRMPMT